MRLIESFEDEKSAFLFYTFLTKEGIHCSYESTIDPKTQKGLYLVWIQEEDEFQMALEWLEHFKKNPKDPMFLEGAQAQTPPPNPNLSSSFKVKVALKSQRPLSLTLTNFLILICTVLFFWNGLQESDLVKKKGAIALQLGMTSIQETLLFDYPKAFQIFDELITKYPMQSIDEIKNLPPEGQKLFAEAESTPTWKGVYDLIIRWKKHENTPPAPLFEKIREGEVWRLFTPCLLHRDFLHILFNMAWLWILGRQMEDRIGKLRFIFFILVTAVVSNVAQYLMSGPYFLGFSGVAVGMAGFIWMRQMVAPWEGYPLQKSVALFLLIFVIAMFLLEMGSFLLQVFSVTNLSPNIANTAHIIGGLTGMLLARIPLFARRLP